MTTIHQPRSGLNPFIFALLVALLALLSSTTLVGFYVDLLESFSLSLPPSFQAYEDSMTMVAGAAIPIVIVGVGVVSESVAGWKRALMLVIVGGFVVPVMFGRVAKADKAEHLKVEAEYRRQVNEGQALIDKGSDPKFHTRKTDGSRYPTLQWRREGKQMIAKAEAWRTKALAEADERKARKGPMTWAEFNRSVLGPAMAEGLLSELFLLAAMALGGYAPWVAGHAPAGPQEPVSAAPPASSPGQGRAPASRPHEVLNGVEVGKLTAEAKNGLDPVRGTWRGLPLIPPEPRRDYLPFGRQGEPVWWPRIRTPDGGVAFIGTRESKAAVKAAPRADVIAL